MSCNLVPTLEAVEYQQIWSQSNFLWQGVPQRENLDRDGRRDKDGRQRKHMNVVEALKEEREIAERSGITKAFCGQFPVQRQQRIKSR